ncbi:hypothetical protein SDC9_156059 [bioreactor metagenome]|uniref:Uncharacterized protein n=1 Tax=bioreactor metagenome TaxID=1076179 RepID=A0A645F837_9ZZZZ
MAADIPQGSGAQQGICDGVQKHIGIGVAGQTQFKGDVDSADDQGAIRH